MGTGGQQLAGLALAACASGGGPLVDNLLYGAVAAAVNDAMREVGAAIGIAIADVRGRIVEANAAFVTMLGYSLTELRRVEG